ncbi:PH domain-containing protein [Thalassotalea marina]|uniref:Membrane protein n=1 Tax=Thalassotalea marina TaxID=1673741 RepID=A0A919EN88_9GAMM|nr:PH domain-containing protein [Thalassotalea marina]GHG03268.1 membrane protein [Thalassotalea marina]
MQQETTPEQSELDTTSTWQRISPYAMLYFLMSFLKHLLGNIVYIAPGIVIGYKSLIDRPQIWLPVAVLVVIALIVGAVLSFYFFTYRLSENKIEIKSGVFKKAHIDLPFARIQNVKQEHPWYFRPFGYVCLSFDTAGSAQQEAKLVAIEHTLADKIKQKILIQHKEVEPVADENLATEASETKQNAANEQILNTRSVKDLVLHGITNNRVWIILAGLSPFIDDLFEKADSYLTSIDINVDQLFSFTDLAVWQIAGYVILLFFALMIPIALLSIAGAIISYYGFTLSKSDDKYIRRSGLFTKHEVTMRLPRLQVLILKQDWLDLLIKRTNLVFAQISSRGGEFAAEKDKIMVPSVTLKESAELIADAMPNSQVQSIAYTGISPWFLVRNFLLSAVFILPFAVIIIAKDTIELLWPLAGVFIILLSLIYCRWRRWGIAIDDQFVYLRKGVLGVDYHCFERFKVQQIQYRQSWFLKRRHLGGFKCILASGALGISFLKEEHAKEIVDQLLYSAESSKRSWM